MKLFIIMILCLLAGANAKSSRMVNGQNALSVVPYYAYVRLHRLPGLEGDSYFGGGSLITQQAVLTVAQNVVGFLSWQVGVGATQIQDLQSFAVATAHQHPDFNATTLANNIAVLRLVNSIPITANTLAVQRLLPAMPFPQPGSSVIIYGFGFSDILEQPAILQTATLSIITQAACGAFYPHLEANNNNQLINHFCAQNGQTNICAGDQGGPVFSPDLTMLIGIQSFNRVADCASPDSQPPAFLRVTPYHGFINDILSL